MPDLSIVIVTYRCWDKLSDCLNSIAASENIGKIQVTVIDNFPDDPHFDSFSAEHPAVQFLRNGGNWGFASGCNLGAFHSMADALLFLNPDTLVLPDSLSNLLASKRQNSQFNLLSCLQLDSKGRNQRAFGYFETFWTSFGLTRSILQKVAPDKYPSARNQNSELLECECISGSVVLISRSDFDKLGGWDERFWMYSEDTDLCWRAHKSGMKVGYEPNATIVHLHGGASRGSTEIKSLTKSEVVISKHAFVSKHQQGLSKFSGHLNVFCRRVLPVLIAALLLLPLSLLKKKTVAGEKAKHLIAFYKHWHTTGIAQSLRSHPAIRSLSDD
jgi:GT2 family glycosyltransferase